MIVYVNNEPRELSAPTTLHQLLEACGVQARRGMAIAINSQVISREVWEQHKLQPGDRIMLIRASKGG